MMGFMLSVPKLYCIVLLFLCVILTHSTVTSLKVRIVTWNVKDNKKDFNDEILNNVLGLIDVDNTTAPDVYAIGLQENCWHCDPNNLKKVGDRFVVNINQETTLKYGLIDVVGTHDTRICELSCKVTHGSTILMLIGKVELGTDSVNLIHHGSCSSNWIRNKEKGVAAIKYFPSKLEKSLCFATTHLDAHKSGARRRCFQEFFDIANKGIGWSSQCSYHFIFGDFNTRTGPNSQIPLEGGEHFSETGTNWGPYMLQDEFAGSSPYGADSEWDRSLMEFINSDEAQPKEKLKYIENKVNFIPTFSIQDCEKFCGGKFPCYRKDRPKSWTDRIVFTKGTCRKYDAILTDFSDHLPVFAEFNVDI